MDSLRTEHNGQDASLELVIDTDAGSSTTSIKLTLAEDGLHIAHPSPRRPLLACSISLLIPRSSRANMVAGHSMPRCCPLSMTVKAESDLHKLGCNLTHQYDGQQQQDHQQGASSISTSSMPLYTQQIARSLSRYISSISTPEQLQTVLRKLKVLFKMVILIQQTSGSSIYWIERTVGTHTLRNASSLHR